jgi:hypothetical protein
VSVKLYVLTCQERINAGVLDKTLYWLARTDWGEPAEVCVQDADVAGNTKYCQTENYRRLLQRIVDRGPNYSLILEDDVVPNRHLEHNVDQWLSEIGDAAIFLGSLYNPNVRPLAETVTLRNGFIADADSVYGSQAFLVPLFVARHCLARWHDVEGMQDIKLSRHTATIPGAQIFYHRPSLVQHGLSAQSTHGGSSHCAEDFDPWWRANDDNDPIADRSWKTIPGWFDWPIFYEEMVKTLPHQSTIVEIGSFLGRSIIHLAQTMKRYRKCLRLVSVDSFIGSESDPMVMDAVSAHGGSLLGAFKKNLLACGVADCVEVVINDSITASRQFLNGSVDVVFLDGDHSRSSVAADIRAWIPKLKPAGYLAGHDIDTYASVGEGIADMLGSQAISIDHSQNLWQFHNTWENRQHVKPIW